MSGIEKFEKYEKHISRGIGFKISGSGIISLGGVTVKVSGSGSLEKDELRISGSGMVEGRLSLREINVSGSLRVYGDLESELIKISGSCRVDGSLIASQASFSGSCMVVGLFAAKKLLEASGSLSTGGLEGGDLKISGSLRSKEINGNSLKLSGTIRVEGDVKCSDIRLTLMGSSYIEGNIEADKLIIRGKETASRLSVLGLIIWAKESLPSLHVKNIKAKEVLLEDLQLICEELRADRVLIGRNVVLEGKVLYKESIQVDPSARLAKEPEKIPD